MAASLHVAFVCPRFADGSSALGGAETLLKALALRAQTLGHAVTFLTTCATDHFTWANVRPPGRRQADGLDTEFFPVDDRDEPTFLRAQNTLCSGRRATEEAEQVWLAEGVNSAALCRHVREQAERYDRIVAGPYLFGLTHAVSRIAPEKTLLVPCLHDEPFARMAATRELFARVRGVLFNTEPERDVAARLFGFPADKGRVVGIGLDPFEADSGAFARRHGLSVPYLVYCGRREPMKGTPLLLDYFSAFLDRAGRDLALVLTGTGSADIPTDCAARVLDAGFVSEQEKREAMAGALAFCHPSPNESLSIVLLEAWLAGTPALVRAASPVLTDQCRRSGGGLWFDNYPEFEEELTLLMDRADLTRLLAENGRAYVQSEYAWPAVDRRLLAALRA